MPAGIGLEVKMSREIVQIFCNLTQFISNLLGFGSHFLLCHFPSTK
jgi:hypothetical protein